MVEGSLPLILIDGIGQAHPTTWLGAATEPGLSQFQRLGLGVTRGTTDRTRLTGSFNNHLDLWVACRPHEKDDDAAPIVWDVLGHWRRPRRRYLRNSNIDEWLGLRGIDAFALLRGLRNDALAENSDPSVVSDYFEHRGRRVLNPFRDRYGNDTSPESEYGDGYRLWRARWSNILRIG